MTKRIIIAGLVAGAAMFIWGFISHMALGLEESAVKDLPNEAPVMAAMQTAIKEPGFYFFPGMEMTANMTKEQKEAAQTKWEEKYAAGPRGIVIFHPDGQKFNMPRRLALQLASQFVVGIILAIVLGHAVTVRTYLGRLALVTLLGLLPFLMVNFPYWNWYAFPRNLTIVSLIDRLTTIFCGGLVLAAMVKPAADAPAPPTRASAPAAATTGALAS